MCWVRTTTTTGSTVDMVSIYVPPTGCTHDGRSKDEITDIVHTAMRAKAGRGEPMIITGDVNEDMRATGIETTTWTALLEELRETFSRQAAALCDALEAALPPGAAILCRPQGGFFVWVTLPKGVSASAAISLAMQGNVGALAGSEFSPSKGFGDCLRCAFTFYNEERLAAAAGVLGAAVTKLAGKAAASKSD